MAPKREDWAAERSRQYIEATLDVPVELWDRDGRQGAYDLRYKLEGRSVAVEVKLVVDEEHRALQERIAKQAIYVMADSANNWRVARRITKDDLQGTDLAMLLESL